MPFNIETLFPLKKSHLPKIYVYSDTSFPGQIKIGFTSRDNPLDRVKEQHPINTPSVTYKLEWWDVAIRNDGTSFIDKDVHRFLAEEGFKQTAEEWFECTVSDVKHAFLCVRDRQVYEPERTLDFKMRPEQEAAVRKTLAYYRKIDSENKGEVPHFLWNAKMRFGKTFTTYELAKAMGAKRVLILTFKPAVEEAWHDDLCYHKDFDGWQFFSSRDGTDPEKLDKKSPIVCFGSFQDYLGKNDSGGIKSKNEWVHTTPWDLIVLDEYHFGAWDDNAKSLLDSGDKDAEKAIDEQKQILQDDGFSVDLAERFDESTMPISGSHYLYLSGTPFRALASGEFLEDQIFNWTYQNEQEAKEKWAESDNPYEDLPMMVLMTYQMPDDLGHLIDNYDMDEFDLNEFFKAEGSGKEARFFHENAVQKWLDILRGKSSIFNSDSPLNKKPPMPFDDVRLLNLCCNTMWFMYSVASCDAMENLLNAPVNAFYGEGYKIVNCSGTEAGIGVDALAPVKAAIGDNPLKAKTIILTCGKLTTGVTIKPLGGILMLRNCSSPETYFQAAFRVQSPWSIADPETGTKEVIKKTCYVFDFAPNRALREIVDYANKLEIGVKPAVEKVGEFIHFLPILQYEGSSMRQMDPKEILDFVDNGTTATLLARRWNSPTLVNVDNATLSRVLKDPRAMEAIMKIEGFRALGKDIIETIVNKADKIKNTKAKGGLTPKEKKKLTDEEKEYKSKRKLVQEKLMKFATRIPIFMYLTDFREEALKDIIRKIEPALFENVTGLTIDDFELLVSLGVFNDSQMNDAILKFRHYEDRSLVYAGINRHEADTRIGAWDTSVAKEDLVIECKAAV